MDCNHLKIIHTKSITCRCRPNVAKFTLHWDDIGMFLILCVGFYGKIFRSVEALKLRATGKSSILCEVFRVLMATGVKVCLH